MTEVTTNTAAPVADAAAPKKIGRPVVEGSVRQQKLAAKQAAIEAGTYKGKGRPVNGTSKRQERLAKKAARIAAGEKIGPGRPKVVKTDAPVADVNAPATPTA